jgi:hypothetical protein
LPVLLVATDHPHRAEARTWMKKFLRRLRARTEEAIIDFIVAAWRRAWR